MVTSFSQSWWGCGHTAGTFLGSLCQCVELCSQPPKDSLVHGDGVEGTLVSAPKSRLIKHESTQKEAWLGVGT